MPRAMLYMLMRLRRFSLFRADAAAAATLPFFADMMMPLLAAMSRYAMPPYADAAYLSPIFADFATPVFTPFLHDIDAADAAMLAGGYQHNDTTLLAATPRAADFADTPPATRLPHC